LFEKKDAPPLMIGRGKKTQKMSLEQGIEDGQDFARYFFWGCDELLRHKVADRHPLKIKDHQGVVSVLANVDADFYGRFDSVEISNFVDP